MSGTGVPPFGIYRIPLFILFFLLSSNLVFSQKWKPLGPFYTPSMIGPKDYSLKMANGVGRVGPLAILKNPDLLLLGTPYGGLWKSADDGASWDSVDTNIPISGVGDIKIDPENRNHWFIVSGDADCMMDKYQPALGSESCQ